MLNVITEGRRIGCTGSCTICIFGVLSGEVRIVKTTVNWTKLVGIGRSTRTKYTTKMVKGQKQRGLRNSQVLDTCPPGEVP